MAESGTGASGASTASGKNGDAVPSGSVVSDNNDAFSRDADLDDAQTTALGDKSSERSDKMGDIAKAEDSDKEHAERKDGEAAPKKEGDEKDDGEKADGKDVPKKYQGKTAAELISTLKAQEKFQGKQTSEIGELRDAVKTMAEQNRLLMEKLSAETPAQQDGDPYNSAVAKLETDVEEGRITPTEFTKLIAELNQTKTEQIVQSALQQSQKATAQQSVEQQYLDTNPDFSDLKAQGIMDRIIQQNPIHDNVSAYEFYKRLEAQAEAESLKAEVASLKKAQAASISAGKEGTRKVLSQPGVAPPAQKTQNQNRKSLNEGAATQSMLDAMRRLRE